MRSIAAENNLLRFERVGRGEQLLILLNLGQDPIQVATRNATVIAATNVNRTREGVDTVVRLLGSEGVVIKLQRSEAQNE
jgi:alpha-glucosidase